MTAMVTLCCWGRYAVKTQAIRAARARVRCSAGLLARLFLALRQRQSAQVGTLDRIARFAKPIHHPTAHTRARQPCDDFRPTRFRNAACFFLRCLLLIL